jgi:hypothetical protein
VDFIGADAANAARVWQALLAFGAPVKALEERDLASPGTFFVMGRPPNQIDSITAIYGISFEDAWSTRVALIANKKAAARPQDLADVAYLEGGSAEQN